MSGGLSPTASLAVIPGADALETLHASAVVVATGVAALCARSGTGKSTLAAHLHQRGYGVWADDAVVWTTSTVGAITFRQGTGSAPSADIGQSAAVDARPFAALLVLERIEQSIERDAVSACRASGASALMSVLPHAHFYSPDNEQRHRDFLLRYVHLAATIPVICVRFRHDLRRIGALCDAVERLIDDTNPRGCTRPDDVE